MKVHRFVYAVCLQAVFFCSPEADVVHAQSPDYSQLTLNFRDVTSTNISQTVEEIEDNEKSIEFGDYDNDGDLDAVMAIAFSSFGQRRNKLYRNDAGVLNEVSGAPVIPGFSFTDNSRDVLMRDFDQDGFLDIIVVCDSNSGSASINSPGRTKYFRNIRGQSFVNETDLVNLLSSASTSGAAEDIDGNGFCDLVVSNHPAGSQDRIAFNNLDRNGAGQFSDLTSTNFPSELGYGQHVEAGDMNGDGQIDLLVANVASQLSFIYYNNNENAGSGQGDFSYPGDGASTQFDASSAPPEERVMLPGDFNNDGKMDFYFANAGGFGAPLSDAVYVNSGNDGNNKAAFAPQAISSDLDSETNKVTTSDLDGDGRLDLLVMSDDRRPFIFRNTSENGGVSFVEWTPSVFTMLHSGWQANSAQLLGDDSADILVGATNNDFLFENTASLQFEADRLESGTLPDVHDTNPIQVTGQLSANGTVVFTSSTIPAGARVSLLLRSLGDVTLEVSDENQTLTSNRQGHGTDEAIQFVHSGGDLSVLVAVEAISFDGNGDGLINLLDVGPFIDCLTGVSKNCDPFDTNDDGIVSLLDINEFVARLTGNSSTDSYFLEILSRSD